MTASVRCLIQSHQIVTIKVLSQEQQLTWKVFALSFTMIQSSDTHVTKNVEKIILNSDLDQMQTEPGNWFFSEIFEIVWKLTIYPKWIILINY